MAFRLQFGANAVGKILQQLFHFSIAEITEIA
jgi:hypothetical protein